MPNLVAGLGYRIGQMSSGYNSGDWPPGTIGILEKLLQLSNQGQGQLGFRV